MLACAWAYTLDRKPLTLEYAYRTLRFLDDAMASPDGDTSRVTGGRLPRRQNPHMHLLEAFGSPLQKSPATALFACVPTRSSACSISTSWRAQEALRSTSTMPGALRMDSSAKSSGPATITNGSGFCMVRPIDRRADPSRASQLFDFATRHGLDGRGRPVEQVDTKGVHQRGAVKLWAMTERLKAHVVRAGLGRDFDPHNCVDRRRPERAFPPPRSAAVVRRALGGRHSVASQDAGEHPVSHHVCGHRTSALAGGRALPLTRSFPA